MNIAELIGRISNDLEIRKTNSNKSILDINLAVKRDKEKTDFIRVVCWEQRADYLNSYAKKGTLIAVVGRIETDTYEKNGNKVYTTYITAEQVEILNQPKDKQVDEDTNNFGGSRSEAVNSIVEPQDLPFY